MDRRLGAQATFGSGGTVRRQSGAHNRIRTETGSLATSPGAERPSRPLVSQNDLFLRCKVEVGGAMHKQIREARRVNQHQDFELSQDRDRGEGHARNHTRSRKSIADFARPNDGQIPPGIDNRSSPGHSVAGDTSTFHTVSVCTF